jgi:hypothetical protein
MGSMSQTPGTNDRPQLQTRRRPGSWIW